MLCPRVTPKLSLLSCTLAKILQTVQLHSVAIFRRQLAARTFITSLCHVIPRRFTFKIVCHFRFEVGPKLEGFA